MEEPYLFFVKFFEMIGLGHFAHAYPHVIYSWVVMVILILFGWLAGKNPQLVQAFVFYLLSVMYFAGAIEEAH